MLRKDFIKLSSISALGLMSTTSFSFQNTPSGELLTGKTSSHIVPGGVIHKQALSAFLEMQNNALKDGIKISIASGFRSFDRQLGIWNRKYKRYTSQGLSSLQAIEKIILYSTIPGTSRHHWGTDIDVIDTNAKQPDGELLNEKNYHGNGPFCQLKAWMEKHSEKHGFYLTYTANNYRKGFNYEPWHYSYQPIAVDYLSHYLNLDMGSVLSGANISGKAELTTEMLKAYRESHVLGINPDLLPK